ncbi:MAG: hypothetical protein A3F14_00285 [Gammaproteobacteria bacterium RIFCSPHIGHO2_12_FULL_43_28]|nr:MAG: hypothetical protein A3F14_00285 [Gammaproteobacteria bacterium RIFCSPHIGHO2_12_FULL_43_28]
MKHYYTLLLLLLIAVVGVFTLDVYLPGIPAMAEQFHVNVREIGYTFTGFTIAFAFCQLIYGAISDSFGRKPVLIIGLSIAAIATILCIYAKSYEVLFCARILQALGISSFVVVNAIVRDLYVDGRAVQVRSMIATASGISIAIAPTIGGLLLGRYSWQGGFYASIILIVLALIMTILGYQETKNNISTHITLSVASSYLSILKDHQFIFYAMIAMLAYAIHFVFIIMSAEIFIGNYRYTPLQFAYFMIVYGFIYFLAGVASTTLAKRKSVITLLQVGGLLISIGGSLMFLAFYFIPPYALQSLLPMSVIIIGVTIVRSSAITGAMANMQNAAGQGAAIINLIQFLVSALIATGINAIFTLPVLSVAIFAFIASLLIIYFRWSLIKNENTTRDTCYV